MGRASWILEFKQCVMFIKSSNLDDNLNRYKDVSRLLSMHNAFFLAALCVGHENILKMSPRLLLLH